MTEILIETDKKPNQNVWVRIGSVILTYLFLTIFFQIVAILIFNIPLNNIDVIKSLNVTQLLIVQFLLFIPTILVVFIYRKYVDNKSIISIGFSIKNRLSDIIMGFIIALLILGIGTFILITLNFVKISLFQFNPYSITISFLLFVLVAFNEELLFRGYILNNLMSSINKYYALLISSAIFALFHSLNFNLSFIAFFNLILAGILLGSAYIFTKNIWFSISLHLFWNFFQGPILGYSVSGLEIASLFKITLINNNFINGGRFGFEGSLICTTLVCISIGFIIRNYLNSSLKQR